MRRGEGPSIGLGWLTAGESCPAAVHTYEDVAMGLGKGYNASSPGVIPSYGRVGCWRNAASEVPLVRSSRESAPYASR
jgi:hypothetical protein